MPGRPFEIEISNFELIEACWGSVVADQVVGHIQTRLRHIGLGYEQQGARHRFRITSDIRTGGPVEWDRLADLSYRLTIEPIAIASTTGTPATALHAVMTWYRDDPPRYRGPRDIQRDHGERWFAIYKSDMQIVAHAFRCAADGRMIPHWQPVCDFRDPSRVLYHEGLVRFGQDGEALTPAIIFPALERTGMATTFDWLMVRRVLEELRADPAATLGVNISASSAHLNGWWRGILAELAIRPDIASRLVVEITETEPIVHIRETIAFAQQVRAIGATVALDDFGAGYTSIRQLMDLVPALVKIDGLFLQRAVRAIQPCHSLPHLIGLIRELGGTVIIEGVETPEMADLAFVSGALWQQGYHYGSPGPVRTGRSGGQELSHVAMRAAG
ncbi:EAL domain-containing protein [Sphingomonas sp. Leaf21]|uniref:EAL domain-containing protein n=1 Tax=Sphingomonas sp. Leaf21 TaxID=2876550 RepID=UPI001E4E9FC2|nr:EAL domain-containing protein [Sphingomonas sp. Leaf21]